MKNANNKILQDYIKRQTHSDQSIRTEWVLWMLRLIADADANGYTVNPDWLRATHKCNDDPEPAMFLKKA